MAVGDAAIRRPLSIARDIRRARLGQDRLSKLLMALIDPNVAPVRALPREERELMIAANNSHLLGFDNLSGLPAWLSDALCRLATGGSFAVRQLYTDDEEVLFQAARPLLVNGIEEVIDRPDLADRSIFLTLPPVADAQRRSERELWHHFELARPRILGALLDLVAQGLRTMPSTGVDRLPRMADFALWVAACETALWLPGTFGAPMRQTAGLRSRASSTPTPSQLACVRSWPSAARGRALPPTFCGSAAVPAVTALRGTVPAGPKTPARSLAGCVGRRPSCGHWASILRAVAKAEPGTGSSGCMQFPAIPSAPSAASVSMTPGSGQPRPRPADDFGDDNPPHDAALAHPVALCLGEGCVTDADDADGADGADANAASGGMPTPALAAPSRPGRNLTVPKLGAPRWGA